VLGPNFTNFIQAFGHGAPHDRAEPIDHQQRALDSPVTGVEHAICAGELATGPMIAQ
jgi:hypothetical protein